MVCLPMDLFDSPVSTYGYIRLHVKDSVREHNTHCGSKS